MAVWFRTFVKKLGEPGTAGHRYSGAYTYRTKPKHCAQDTQQTDRVKPTAPLCCGSDAAGLLAAP